MLAAPSGGFTLARFTLSLEQDVVSLCRRTRSAAEEFGLDDTNVRGLFAAAYEIGRFLWAQEASGHAELAVVDGPALQVIVRATSEAAVGDQIVALAASLRPMVRDLSVSRDASSVTVRLSVPFPVGRSASIENGAHSAWPRLTEVDPAPAQEDSTLPPSCEQLLEELRQSNRTVVALYAELDGIAEHLRETEDRLRLLEEDLPRRAEDLAAANRAKEDFFATLSHELRTPLNAMLGWTCLLRTGRLDEAGVARALETIERNARIQEQLIADILDVSSIVTGKLRVELDPIELAPIVAAALSSVRPAAEAKGVALASTVAFTGTVRGDVNRLHQVVWNLLANAIKFTPAGGRIRVGLDRLGSTATVTVTDTGEGIAPELLPFIFDRFRQGDASVTRRHAGLGLGLSIVRHIIELHGGSVQVASDGPGQGAVFSVHLPIHAIQHAADESSAVDPQLNPVKVLEGDPSPVPKPIEVAELGAAEAALAPPPPS